ncbi:unnamed protein product [Aphanomyces euteiches]|uniref:Mechanosensitive ion channel MscS domain-containing protein n=1 Tax=Aphanomyces euteiches TaxID=100861 RepID=A0A6G0WDJ6_9STRA|nr:hypothetical protein Ae201684_016166 [Aphanomyces euteiches]KAH9052132.1 hypothetical protein Ae201684P_013634 [Aphanomyces euteiches]KAH9155430.1 hypothetical protein AeRB84_002598 [Aphanomyces euteiches]
MANFTATILRVGIGLALIVVVAYFRDICVRSFFRFVRERFGRSVFLGDVERHFTTSISIAIVLLACFVGFVIAGYNDVPTVNTIFLYAAGILLILSTRAFRIVFTKWLIRSLGWDVTVREDYSRVLIVTEGIGVIVFFIISIEIFAIFVPSTTAVGDIVVVFFIILEAVCILSFYTTVQNAVAGFFLIFAEPFRLGSLCAIGTSTGVVERIALHSTRLRAEDGAVIHVPNGILANDVQRNFTDCSFRRVHLLVHVAHNTPLSRVLLLIHHLKEELVSCVISLDQFLDQIEKLKPPSEDTEDSDTDDERTSVVGSLRTSRKQPSVTRDRDLAVSAASTDVSESMMGLDDLSRSTLTRNVPATVDPRLLQVTLGGMYRIWVSALVPGNDLMGIAMAKSNLNLAIMRCLESHRIPLHASRH